MSDILTKYQVAEMLQIAPEAVHELTRARSQARHDHPIPFIKVAGKLRFRKTDVDRWLDRLAGREAA
jgi:hypothetical protein